VERGARALRALWVALACASAGCDAFDPDALAPLTSLPPRHPQPSGADAGTDAAANAPPNDRDGSARPGLDGSLGGDGGGAGSDDGLDAALQDAAPRDASASDDAGDPDASACAQASVNDYCASLPELRAAPVIDGVLDCGPPLRMVTPSGWNGAASIPSGHTAQLALAYRVDGLYAYLEVRGQTPVPHPSDSAIYCGDAVELYVDADGTIASDGAYDAPGTMQFIFAAPASAAEPLAHAERFLSGTSQGAWTSAAYRVAWLTDGYAVEAFIAAADMGLATWKPGTALGIDVVIDIAGPAAGATLRCGRQLGQYFMRVSALTPSRCNGEPWCDARAFCTPSL